MECCGVWSSNWSPKLLRWKNGAKPKGYIRRKGVLEIVLSCYCYVEPKHRAFCKLSKSAESKVEEFLKAHHCCLAGGLASLSPQVHLFSPQNSQTSLACRLFCNTCLQSVLTCTLSSALLGCSVAPCVGHVSPPLPPCLLLLLLLPVPRRPTRDFRNALHPVRNQIWYVTYDLCWHSQCSLFKDSFTICDLNIFKKSYFW